MIQKLRKNRKGFTLIELIVVIAILGILAAILIPQFTGFQEKARSSQMTVEAKQIATAADAVQMETPYVAASEAAFILKVQQIAGTDVNGTIDITGVTNGHVTFTYDKTIETVAYTATRIGTGEITVTW